MHGQPLQNQLVRPSLCGIGNILFGDLDQREKGLIQRAGVDIVAIYAGFACARFVDHPRQVRIAAEKLLRTSWVYGLEVFCTGSEDLTGHVVGRFPFQIPHAFRARNIKGHL